MTHSEQHLAGEHARFSVAESTHLVLPGHANLHGTLFGGQLVSWLDLTATLSAMRHAIHPVVTASIEELSFLKPVYVGQAIIIQAKAQAVFHSSIEVGVLVHSFYPDDPQQKQLICRGVFTFVAVNSKGIPLPIRPLLLETEDEKKQEQLAIERRQRRQKHRIEQS